MVATTQETKPENICLGCTEEDWRLMTALRRKLGLNTSGVLRQAIRKLAEKEGIRQ